MGAYKAITSQTPPSVGSSKPLWSPDLFDDATGAYPKATLPTSSTYPVDSNGKLAFFERSQPTGSPFVITTGHDLIGQTSDSTKLSHEQALWAVGRFSYFGGVSREADTGSQNGGGQDAYDYSYLPESPGGTSVVIDGVTYAIASHEWTDVIDSTTTGPNPAGTNFGIHTTNTSAASVTLAGAPNLSSILSIGKTVYWAS